MDALTTQENKTAKQYIVVRIGNEQYGINIKYIDNIVRMQKITRVPKSQPYFLGVINLRGEIFPIMSIRRKFGIDDDEITNSTRIIILKPDQQSMVGVLVDAVQEVVTLDEDSIEKTTVAAEDGQIFIYAVGKHNDELISLLNVHALVLDKE